MYEEARRESRVCIAGGIHKGDRILQEEEVFLAQLYRRAQLLNDEFQERVVAVIQEHSAGAGIDGEDCLDQMEGPSENEAVEGEPVPAEGKIRRLIRRGSQTLSEAVSPMSMAAVRMYGWMRQPPQRVVSVHELNRGS